MTPKQTAVEWLQVQLNENGKLSAVDFYQAKAMDKEQHKQTYYQGLNSNFQDFEQKKSKTNNTKKP
jgi:hypothetical protein